MTDKQDPITHAARLLREAAEELRQAHTYPGSEGWENETDAKAAYDEHMAAAQALEDWEAAVGAGGVQALSAAPAGFVPVAAFDRLHAHAESLAARLLAAEQAAPKAAPGEPVHGDVLPPVGSRVYIRHGRDKDAHACTVTGYYAWGDLGGDKRLHRVFVRLVYEGTDIQQTRMLCDCYSTAEAALAQAAPQQEAQEPTTLDQKTMELAESVGLIGPASRIGDLHAAIQRFHDLICVNATIKAAVMAADVISGVATPARDYPPLPMQFACSGVFPVYSADQMRAYVDADRAAYAPGSSQPAPAPLSDDVVRDAARWRWLSEHIGAAWNEGKFTSLVRIVSDKNRAALNASIDRMMTGDWSDAALAAQGGE